MFAARAMFRPRSAFCLAIAEINIHTLVAPAIVLSLLLNQSRLARIACCPQKCFQAHSWLVPAPESKSLGPSPVSHDLPVDHIFFSAGPSFLFFVDSAQIFSSVIPMEKRQYAPDKKVTATTRGEARGRYVHTSCA